MAADVPLAGRRSTDRGRALGARAEAPVRGRRRRGACAVAAEPAASSAGEWDEAALAARRDRLLQLSERIGAMADMDFGFLYDPARDLLSIGYNVDDRRRDAGHYDLLASEVRLASFVAIASGQIPQASWFALGRQLATLDGKTVLLSWSGSMFEYLMPMLVMPSYENTLLDETMRGAVRAAGALRHASAACPGASPSRATTPPTPHLNYQYRAFGVPGLGLKRGLAEDLVVAPYATMMALMVDPKAAVLEPAAPRRRGPRRHATASTRRSTTRRRGCRAARRARSCARTWRTTRAWACWRWPTCCSTGRCSGASSPTRALQATLLLLQERVPRAVPFHPEMAERVDFRSGQPTHRDAAARDRDAATRRRPKCSCCPTAATT